MSAYATGFEGHCEACGGRVERQSFTRIWVAFSNAPDDSAWLLVHSGTDSCRKPGEAVHVAPNCSACRSPVGAKRVRTANGVYHQGCYEEINPPLVAGGGKP